MDVGANTTNGVTALSVIATDNGNLSEYDYMVTSNISANFTISPYYIIAGVINATNSSSVESPARPSLWYGMLTCMVPRFFFDGIITPIIAILGFLGNALTITVMWHDRNTSPTAFLLIVLAILDDLVLIGFLGVIIRWLCIYRRAVTACVTFTYYMPYYAIPFAMLAATSQLMAIYTILLVTLQRYISVCWPTLSNRITMKVVQLSLVLTLLGCLCFVSPRYFEYRIYFDNQASAYMFIYKHWASGFGYRVVYGGIFYYIVYFLIPMTFLIFATYKLVTTLNKVRNKKETMTMTKRNETDLTLSLVVVVIVFMVFQMANPIRRLLVEILHPSQLGCGTFYNFFISISLFCIYVNSSVNFLIYCVCARRFRMRLVAMLKCYSKIGMVGTSTHDGTSPLHGGSHGIADTKTTKAGSSLQQSTSKHIDDVAGTSSGL